MKRGHNSNVDPNEPCSSSSSKIPAPRRAPTSEKPAADFVNDPSPGQRSWTILKSKLRDAVKRRCPNIVSPLGLFQVTHIRRNWNADEYEINHKDGFSTTVFVDTDRNSASRLTGFDNTGNIRLWPGGESLAAYFLLSDPSIFTGKDVLELGSGLFGLPGLVCSKSARTVVISDGNQLSVDTVANTILKNAVANASSRLLLWQVQEEERLFDLILAADCVFFSDAHKSLLDTCYSLLVPSPSSTVYICSPKRKGSLETFLKFVETDGRFTALAVNEFSDFMSDKLSCIDSDDVPHLYALKRK